MNAVFFGVKQEPGNESEAGSSSVVPGSTSGAVSLATRKHVLQVSTYQVEVNKLTYYFKAHLIFLFLDVCAHLVQ